MEFAIWMSRGDKGMNSKLFKCVMMMGHRGAGKSWERVFYLRAASVGDAMRRVKGYGGVKKGRRFNSAGSLLSLELVA